MDLSPTAVDNALASIYAEQERIRGGIANTITNIHRHLGENPTRHPRNSGPVTWPTTDAQAEAAARTGKGVDPWRTPLLGADVYDLDRLRRHLDDLANEADPFERAYEQHAWSRFYLVPGGHIHAFRGCRTLRPTTTIGWLPDLSGSTEAQAVKEHGPLLCSVCFPTAPVEWTVGPAQESEDVCPGSRQAPVDGTITRRAYSTYGKCTSCGARQVVTSALLVRKHKAAGR